MIETMKIGYDFKTMKVTFEITQYGADPDNMGWGSDRIDGIIHLIEELQRQGVKKNE